VHAIQQPPILQEDNITYPAQTETNNRQFKIKINSITAKAQNKYKEPKQRAFPQEQKIIINKTIAFKNLTYTFMNCDFIFLLL
jgi:hypothetical protein